MMPLNLNAGTHTLGGVSYTVTHSAAGVEGSTTFLGSGQVVLNETGSANGTIFVSFAMPVTWEISAAPDAGVWNAHRDSPVTIDVTGGVVDAVIADPDDELSNEMNFGTSSASFSFRYNGPSSNANSGPNNNDYISRNQDWIIGATASTLMISPNALNGDKSGYQIMAAVPEAGASLLLMSIGLGAVLVSKRPRADRRA